MDATKYLLPQMQIQLGIKLITNLKGDALDEFYHAATLPKLKPGPFNSPVVLRVVPGSVNPNPETITTMIENHLANGLDYSRSEHSDDACKPFIEIMNLACLQEAWREALLPDDREQITPYIYRQHQRLAISNNFREIAP